MEFSMAYQPIVDIEHQNVFAQEALVRGVHGEGASSVLDQVTPDAMYRFDQKCRSKAIEVAAQQGIDTRLSINFMPRAIYEPENGLAVTIAWAEKYGIPMSQLIFEVSETERLDKAKHLKYLIDVYQSRELSVAFDDFGVNHLGLDTLVEYQPKIIKVDRFFVDHIDQNKRKHVVTKSLVDICQALDIQIVAEGIERVEEAKCLYDLGINLMQGYLFAKPGFETLPVPNKANMLEATL